MPASTPHALTECSGLARARYVAGLARALHRRREVIYDSAEQEGDTPLVVVPKGQQVFTGVIDVYLREAHVVARLSW
jgi:hypothetical protein